jgi:hypothetical protein
VRAWCGMKKWTRGEEWGRKGDAAVQRTKMRRMGRRTVVGEAGDERGQQREGKREKTVEESAPLVRLSARCCGQQPQHKQIVLREGDYVNTRPG